jgi:ferredoxin
MILVKDATCSWHVEVHFDEEKTFTVDIDSKVKIVHLPKLIKEVDLIINLPKLKTHALTEITIAVKNLYGFIPGSAKSYYHKIFHNPEDFSKFLLELNNIIKPNLNIVDGITGIQGLGPGATGEKIDSNVIFASTSSIALDIVAADKIGYKKNEVPTNNLSINYFNEQIEVLGDYFYLKFIRPNLTIYKPILNLMKIIPKPKISFDHKLCIKCHNCEKNCPTKAIKLDPYPICTHKKCIKCFCCIEVCPTKAVNLKDSKIYGLAKNFYHKLKDK